MRSKALACCSLAWILFWSPEAALALPLTLLGSFDLGADLAIPEFGVPAPVGPEGIAVESVSGGLRFWITDEGGFVYAVGDDGKYFDMGQPGFFHPFELPPGEGVLFHRSSAEGAAIDPFATLGRELLITNTSAPGVGIHAFPTDVPNLNSTPNLILHTYPAEEPEGIAVHPLTGNFWIADEHDKQIYEFERDGTLVTRFSVSGIGGISGASGNGPEDLTFSLDGQRLYILDDTPGAPLIGELATDGSLLREIPIPASFGIIEPEGMVIASTGTLYILDKAQRKVFATTLAPTPEPSAPVLFGAGALLSTLVLARRRASDSGRIHS